MPYLFLLIAVFGLYLPAAESQASSCSKSYKLARSISPVHDSARYYIEAYRSCIQPRPHDTCMMDYYLVLAGFYNVRGMVDSVEYCNKAIMELNKASFNAPRLAAAQLGMGIVQQSRLAFADAIHSYQKALETAQQCQNIYIKSFCLKNLGGLHLRTYQLEEAIRYYKQAFEAAINTQNTVLAGESAQDLAYIYNKNKNFEQALFYIEQARKHYSKTNDYRRFHLDFMQMNIDMETKQPIRPDTLAPILWAIYNQESPHVISSAFSTGAKLWLHIGKLDSAKVYLDSAFAYSRDFAIVSVLNEVYDLYARWYELKGDYKQALLYSYKHIELRDSIMDADLRLEISTIKSLYELDKKEQQIVVLEQQRQIDKTWNWALGVGLFMSSLMLVALAFLLKQRNKLNQVKLLQKSLEIENQQIALEKQDLELQNQQIQNEQLSIELDHRNRELMTTTVQIIKKGELIEQLRKDLKPIGSETTLSIESKNKLAIVQESLRNEQLFDADWNTFRQHFEKVHPQFLLSLQRDYPSLTSNDLRHCAYLRMNLSRREIALMMNVSIDAIKMARNRLKKKMGIESEENLTSLLSDYK